MSSKKSHLCNSLKESLGTIVGEKILGFDLRISCQKLTPRTKGGRDRFDLQIVAS